MPDIDPKQKANSFFKKAKKRVAEKQREIVEDTMDTLWRNSPHYLESRGEQAKGEYDANHKVVINNKPATPHNPATRDKERSRFLHNQEAAKKRGVECGDSVRILNTTEHATDVEYGGALWIKTPGYYTYKKTKAEIKGTYKNVLE